MRKIIVPLANGFEEIEAITSIDVLRRAEVEVTTVSLDSLQVKGAHQIEVLADCSIENINSSQYDGILLPGGLPGATHLRDDERVIKLVQDFYGQGKLVAAICAAPIVLEKAGVLENKQATSYPGFEEQMPSCQYLEDRVVLDGNVITGRGPGAALEFVLKVVEYLVGKKVVQELKEGMIVDF